MPANDLLYDAKKVFKSEVGLIKKSLICRITSFARVMPDFFVGGVQKGGTTSLFYALSQHPQVIRPKIKEMFYYGTTPNYEKGLGYYKQFFATSFYKKSRESKIGKPAFCMEASTNTFDNKEAAQRILKDNPKAKIIFIFRNPVERAYSQYKMSVKLGWEFADFEKAIELEQKRIDEGKIMNPKHNYAYQRLGYKSRGIYVNQLKHWLNEFPKENIFVTSSEAFFANPQQVYNSICQFLGIEEDVKVKFDKLNEGSSEKMNPEIKSKLNEFYKPYNEELFKLINQKFDWSR